MIRVEKNIFLGNQQKQTGGIRPNWQNPASKHPTFRGMILQTLPAQWWKPNAYGRFQSNIVGDTAPQIGWFHLFPRE